MMLLLTEPWPFWLGAIAFMVIVMLIFLVEQRLIGVSGSYYRLVRSRDKASREVIAMLKERPELVEDALLRATAEEFGEEAARQAMEQKASAASIDSGPTKLTKGANAAFLLMLVLGGGVGALVSGGWTLRTDLGPTYTKLFGSGAHIWLLVFVGGLLTGFGTRMAAGCTTGHGLAGCSRFQLGSVLATGSFFGVAVAISLALRFFVV